HDWILDPIRVNKMDDINSELIAAADIMAVRLVQLGGETPEGYSYMRFLVAAPSMFAFNKFKTVAEKWGFNEWTVVSEQEDAIKVLHSPYWEILKPLRVPGDGDGPLFNAKMQVWYSKALDNEELKKRHHDLRDGFPT